MELDEREQAIVRRAEQFARESRADGAAQRNWARSCPEPVRAFFLAIRANTPGAYREVVPTPHDPNRPTLGDLSQQLQDMLQTYCWPEWSDTNA
jgi:hypothetical protein